MATHHSTSIWCNCQRGRHSKSHLHFNLRYKPLAADWGYALKDDEEAFQMGIEVLRKFTQGPIHLNQNINGEVSSVFSNVTEIQQNKFSGPHPAGNVGIQIHHIAPIAKGDLVWTVSPFGVAQIGKLF